MFFFALLIGADPIFVVENKCPAFTVTNKCPAPKVKSRYTNGFNCSAGFCKANGGTGCPSCPNNSGGTCACGAVVAKQALPYTLFESCPSGTCPTVQGRSR